MTEAAAQVCGQEARDGLIRSKLHSREEMPKLTNKKQRKVHQNKLFQNKYWLCPSRGICRVTTRTEPIFVSK